MLCLKLRARFGDGALSARKTPPEVSLPFTGPGHTHSRRTVLNHTSAGAGRTNAKGLPGNRDGQSKCPGTSMSPLYPWRSHPDPIPPFFSGQSAVLVPMGTTPESVYRMGRVVGMRAMHYADRLARKAAGCAGDGGYRISNTFSGGLPIAALPLASTIGLSIRMGCSIIAAMRALRSRVGLSRPPSL
jgi:hypothetical protein